jgi:iron complex outermembrane recepter protein
VTPSVRRISTMLLAGSAAALTASVAQAQDQASTPAAADAPAVDKGDIVVTARRRDETAQRIPISIGVVTPEAIAKTGLASIADLPSIAPGVTIAKPPAGAEAGVTIRGLGSAPGAPSFDSSVSLFVDGIYAPRAREFAGSLFDVERIEVIRGTQAALLGKNTSLGAINLITRKPGSTFEIDARTAYDFKLGSRVFGGGVDVPLSDTLRVRVSGQSSYDGGWVYNVINDDRNPRTHDDAIRGIAVWKPTSTLDVTALAQHDLTRVRGNPTEFIAISSAPPLAPLLQQLGGFPGTLDTQLDRRNATYFGVPGGEQAERLLNDRYGLTANLKLGEYTLTSITGYSRYHDANDFDADGQAGNWATRSVLERSRQFSQEVRLVSPASRPLDYVIGALYIDNHLFNQTTIAANYPFGPVPGVLLTGTSRTDFDQSTKTESVFGQSTYRVTDRLRLEGGLRYTHENKSVVLGRVATMPGFYSIVASPPYASFGRDRRENNLDYSGGVQFDLTRDAMLYVSYGKGTKSGGFASNTTLLDRAEYSSERARTLEAGVKLQDAGRRWLLNLSVFNTDVDGFQTVTFNGVSFDITNQNLRSRGFEIESWWSPLTGLRLFANGTYAHVRDRQTDARIPLSPELQGSAGISYQSAIGRGLQLGVDASVDHRSSRTSQNDPAVPVSAPFTPINASVAVGAVDKRWELRLIGRNLANDNSAAFVFPTPFLPAGNYNAVSERPTTITLQFSVRY